MLHSGENIFRRDEALLHESLDQYPAHFPRAKNGQAQLRPAECAISVLPLSI